MEGDRRWVWRRKGEAEDGAFVKAEKFAKSIPIFPAIGKGYTSKLFIVEGNLNRERDIASRDARAGRRTALTLTSPMRHGAGP
jgi:hypothetical protein